MLYEREKRLMTLLSLLGGAKGSLDFQKFLFLFCNEIEQTPSYEFVPYQYGAFSFTSYADKRRLIQQGLLADEEKSWRLTELGKQTILSELPNKDWIKPFAKQYKALAGDALVAEAYRRYPYYAINSKIRDRVLAGDKATLKAVEDAQPELGQSGICTIGYEGLSLEDYLNRLIRNGVTILCDVRRNPISRKYGFSKRTLSKACENLSIRYEHLPELGIATDERRDLKTQADYDALFANYKRDYLPWQSEALGKIAEWESAGNRVVLTCYERLPFQCHRHCVAEALQKMSGNNLIPKHL